MAVKQQESVSGYFRGLFNADPTLWERSKGNNKPVFDLWLRDNPGAKEVPEKVQQILSNVKTLLGREKGDPLRRKTRSRAGVLSLMNKIIEGKEPIEAENKPSISNGHTRIGALIRTRKPRKIGGKEFMVTTFEKTRQVLPGQKCDELEFKADEAIILAKEIGGLDDVVEILRKARNRVIVAQHEARVEAKKSLPFPG